MRKMINATHIEGLLYEHKLEVRESGPNSKNPGTKFIMGTVDIATDDLITNIVSVHFTYVTATTAKGATNATFTTLMNIIDGKYGSVMVNGKDNAVKLRIDSALGLNEFYAERNGQEELVSAKRNEGGFVHVAESLNDIGGLVIKTYSKSKITNIFKYVILMDKVYKNDGNITNMWY